ncbi:hypothetical protein [Paenibacillus piri]|uniref:Uncharacterized protein n=1 Tax=Paenibacillus piri TaxID=2547395 RepID=A0A4R5KFP6_9BACL|nr:hypothetical protein [Paenibacillus piri]TDF94133.1 hypothetical protein E1757_24910 [Paenibacillus piri]
MMISMPPSHNNTNPKSTAPRTAQTNQITDSTSTGTLQFRGAADEPSQSITPAQFLYLQRTIGNRATSQLVKSRSQSNPFNEANQAAVSKSSAQNSPLSEGRVKPAFQLKNGDFVRENQVEAGTIQRVIVNKSGNPLTGADKDTLFKKYAKYHYDQERRELKRERLTPAEMETKYRPGFNTELEEFEAKHTGEVKKKVRFINGKFAPWKYTPKGEQVEMKKKISDQRKEDRRELSKDRNYDTSMSELEKKYIKINIDPFGQELVTSRYPTEAIVSKSINLAAYFGRGEAESVTVTTNKVSRVAGLKDDTETETETTDIMSLPEHIIFDLVSDCLWYNDPDSGSITAASPLQSRIFNFGETSRESIEMYLRLKYAILTVEAQGRSGVARAAKDEYKGATLVNPPKIRDKWANEARYSARTSEPSHKPPETKGPKFTADRISEDKLSVTITHQRPDWNKGPREPSQIAVMGGQNAKNHVIDHLPKGKSKEEWHDQLPGRFEWLHVVGSSLGGYNTANNLVAGSYDMNTKMIALEHKIVRMGKEKNADADGDGDGEEGYNFVPTESKPLVIQGTAKVKPGTNVGEEISLSVTHGGEHVITENYAVDDQHVIYRTQYLAAEEQIRNKLIEKKKAILKSLQERRTLSGPSSRTAAKKVREAEISHGEKKEKLKGDIEVAAPGKAGPEGEGQEDTGQKKVDEEGTKDD